MTDPDQDTLPDSPSAPDAPADGTPPELPQTLRDDFARFAGAPVEDDVIRLAASMDRAGAKRWAGKPRIPALARDMTALIKVATVMHRAATHPDINEAERAVTMASVAWVFICEAVQSTTELDAARAIMKHAPKSKGTKAKHKPRRKPRRRK